MTIDHEEVKKKQLHLTWVKKELKKQFIGIDDVIDNFIGKVQTWYCYPELLVRPLIINLVSLTGGGKTDLIAKFVQLLDMSDRCVSLNLSQGSKHGTYQTTIEGALLNVGVTPKHQGVLVLDELQAYRTIGVDNKEYFNYEFGDMWKLMSDGKLVDDSLRIKQLYGMLTTVEDFIKSKMDSTQNRIDTENSALQTNESIPKLNPNPNTFNKSQSIMEAYTATYYFGRWEAKRLINLLDLPKEKIDSLRKTISLLNMKKDPMIQMLIKSSSKGTAGETNEFLRILNSIPAIMVKELILNRIDELANIDHNDPLDGIKDVYSKLLIFTCSNIDEMYKIKDIDSLSADELHESTSNLKIENLKIHLENYYRKEQVARFGNNWIIYSSLTKDNFIQIIKNELAKQSELIKRKTGVYIDFSQNEKFINRLYKVGVVPSHGVRPVFSTIGAIVGEIIPKLLVDALTNNETTIVYKGE